MNRLATACVAVLGSALVAGCHSSTYQPNATDSQLSAYAASHAYPQNVAASTAPALFYSVDQNGTITLSNAGPEGLMGFDLWVNKQFVINVDKLPGHTSAQFQPGQVFNSGGNSLASSGVKPEAMTVVEVFQGGKLMTVQGPVNPM